MSTSSRIVWSLTTLSMAASLLLWYQQATALMYVALAPALISIIYLITLHRQLASFSSMVVAQPFKRINQLFTSIRKHFEQQQKTINYLVEAINNVGKEGNQQQPAIEGEAGKAVQLLYGKLESLKADENRRVWASQGIAQISEIRKDNASLNDYAFHVISHLVKFLQANQGVFYVKNDEEGSEPHLELLATYAYGRRKHTSEPITLSIGTGLVGQCALEGSMILLTDVPKDYIKITSGLGEALPKCVTLTPLIFRNEIFGVIEIASFQKFEQYQIDFINKACETIGLELSGIKTQERTRKLLEQSQEEELRQNLEEMKATQLEMIHKEEQLSQQLENTKRAMAMAESERQKNEAILEGCMDAVISFNQQGYVEYFNAAAEDVFSMSRQEIVGQPVSKLLSLYIQQDDQTGVKVISASGSEVTLRTEVSARDKKGEEISLLLTATKVKIEEKYLFTLFAQKVSVELF